MSNDVSLTAKLCLQRLTANFFAYYYIRFAAAYKILLDINSNVIHFIFIIPFDSYFCRVKCENLTFIVIILFVSGSVCHWIEHKMRKKPEIYSIALLFSKSMQFRNSKEQEKKIDWIRINIMMIITKSTICLTQTIYIFVFNAEPF